MIEAPSSSPTVSEEGAGITVNVINDKDLPLFRDPNLYLSPITSDHTKPSWVPRPTPSRHPGVSELSEAEIITAVTTIKNMLAKPQLIPNHLVVIGFPNDKQHVYFRLCVVLESFTEFDRQQLTRNQRCKLDLLLQEGSMAPSQVNKFSIEAEEEVTEAAMNPKDSTDASERYTASAVSSNGHSSSSEGENDELYLRVYDGHHVRFVVVYHLNLFLASLK
jgi:hypothetical protein